jgi:hypothetical protein
MYWNCTQIQHDLLTIFTSTPQNEACLMTITHAMNPDITKVLSFFLSFLLTYLLTTWCQFDARTNKDIISRLEQSLGFRVFKFQKQTKLPSLWKTFFLYEGYYPLSQKQHSHHETILEIFINKHLRTKKQTSSNYFKNFFLFKKKSFCFVSRNIEFSINLIFYEEHNKPPPSPPPPHFLVNYFMLLPHAYT